MHPLVANALSDINNTSLVEKGEAFLQIADVVSVNCMTNFSSNIPEIDSIELSVEELEEIKSVLLKWIHQNKGHAEATSAIWALSKFHSKSLKPDFDSLLDHYLQNVIADARKIGQLLVNLSDLGESTIPTGSYASFEYSQNIENAMKYAQARNET